MLTPILTHTYGVIYITIWFIGKEYGKNYRAIIGLDIGAYLGSGDKSIKIGSIRIILLLA